MFMICKYVLSISMIILCFANSLQAMDNVVPWTEFIMLQKRSLYDSGSLGSDISFFIIKHVFPLRLLVEQDFLLF